MQQYEWPMDAKDNRLYEYTQEELERRKAYLLHDVDPDSKASAQDIEELLQQGGKQIICWGAGAGKTTALRQFITRNWQTGVIYAARTIEEVDAFAYDVTAMIGSRYVFSLHSECPHQWAYYEDPSIIERYPVIVTTHARLILDPPNYFTKFTPIHNPSHTRRNYIFIDENPQFFKRLELNEASLALFYAITQGTDDIETAKNSMNAWLDSINTRQQYAAARLRQILAGAAEDNRLNRDRYLHYATIVLTSLREGTFLEIKKLPTTEDEKPEKGYLFYYHLGLLDVPHLLIFDGTGDLTNRGSQYFTLTKPPKFAYRFVGKATRFEDEMVSRYLSRVEGSPPEKLQRIIAWIGEFVLPTIQELAQKHEKLLIITWLAFKEEAKTLIDPDNQPGGVVRNDTLTPEKNLSDYLDREIAKCGVTNVVLTHYQSGLTRATSKFADCDAVLFLGNFYLPNSAIAEYNQVNKTAITAHTYSMAEIIQGIYRTRIRLGQSVSTYFSSDWPKDIIDDCLRYMHAVTDSGRDLTVFNDAERLRRLLKPDPRNRAFDLITTKATELLTTAKAEYIIPAQTSSGDNYYRSMRRSAERLCKGQFKVSGKRNRLILERIQNDENAPNPVL